MVEWGDRARLTSETNSGDGGKIRLHGSRSYSSVHLQVTSNKHTAVVPIEVARH